MNRHAQSLSYALHILKQNKYKKFLKAIYLFGSCARGEQKYDSDVDLFLFIEKDTPDNIIREIRCVVSPDDFSLPSVEVKYSVDDKFSSSYQFQLNLEKDARLIWEKNNLLFKG